ncbi:MarR family winged helix-turn-helix transcriptional regulator [Psychrobacillus sp. NEAU-3TGS]|uniref:MarR family winged helix-turn-helix transcriptional regulator n=1 Tax=Psychrobacillus sp. NEAU-3TGS TaxID=2995412 RepID=UPI002496DA6D|nr:MarR family winged helix-turn-helix transcriptional regulator [Psychrobacillus sp. NEAU-3TGS]MDI2585841.1 MarR family winged helix-turn-helix transcriptional regulator [Psychrobacillus sp. NEAU-3TGS]
MENKRELFQVLTRRFGLLNKNCCSIGAVDISSVQSHILYEIDKQTSPSMQQIAEAIAMDITTFSRQIQTLIKMELVKKTPSSADKRVSILSLTVQGKFVATTIDESMNAYLEEVFSHMNEFERETVIRSIKLLNQAMSKSSVCCTPLL